MNSIHYTSVAQRSRQEQESRSRMLIAIERTEPTSHFRLQVIPSDLHRVFSLRLPFLCSEVHQLNLSTSQKPLCVRPKLSNVRPLWFNIAHCSSVPRHPPKTQSLSKLSEGLKFAYADHHTIENHLNIVAELYAILCGGRKEVSRNSYVDCGTKARVGQNVSRTMRFSAPICNSL